MSTTTSATANEYYAKNALGQLRCKLCDTLHRDDANFLIHVEGNRHTKNLKIIELRKAQQRQDQEERYAIAQQEKHSAHQEQLAQLSNGAIGIMNALSTSISGKNINNNNNQNNLMMMMMPTVGFPEMKVQVDEIGTNKMHSRVTFTLSYPLANTTGSDSAPPSRPMHRWLNTYEQSVEARDPSKQYLVFACEPYESVAYAFPSNIAVATAENTDAKDIQRYFCRWNPIDKTYLLMFTISHR